jgi:threonine aldolase
MSSVPAIQSLGWSAAGWGSFIFLCGIIVRQIGPWRKQSADAAEKLRDGLLARVTLLESQLLEQAAKHEKQLADVVARFEAKLDTERLDNENEAMVMRHRLNNITACFDSFLMLVKANPEKASEAVLLIEEMRSKQVLAEATEKATLRGVRTTTTTTTTGQPT